MSTSANTAPHCTYRERLSVPVSWHLVTPIFAVLFGGESVLTSHVGIAATIMVGFWLVGELALWSLGRRLVTVVDGRIRAGNWRLPVAQVRSVATLDRADMRAEQRRRDEDVYHCTAPWVRTGVLLDVDDPEDLPLWLVSTRHPAALARALADAAGTPAASAEVGPPVDRAAPLA